MKVGFIGCGNMGGALLSAVQKSIPGSDIMLADHHDERVMALCGEYGVIKGSTKEIAETCEYIFLGVKPQALGALLSEISPALAKRDDFVLVTMAAGVTIEKIREMCKGAYPVIRIMPNTPASVGEGMILYVASPEINQDKINVFLSILKAAGTLDSLPEKLIDAASALSGCGPAFVDLFIEALSDGAVACGLPRQKALLYAEQTILGAAKLALESGEHPAKLKDSVCSPGGSTIEGVRALERGAFRSDVISAVAAAYLRTKQLGEK